MKNALPYWLLLLGLFLFLVVSVTLQAGMFNDGLLYSCVGKNMAAGIGSFWEPRLSETLYRQFHEQPPLMFALEAGFFKLLGNGMYTERIYTLMMAVLSLVGIVAVWKQLAPPDHNHSRTAWMPLLCWLIMPVVFWAYPNNVEEGTMVVFVLLAVWLMLKGLLGGKHIPLWLFAGGLALCAASLCKGIQGLFPLTLPALYWLTHRRYSFSKAVTYSLIPLITVAVFYGILLISEEARNSYYQYFQSRFVRTFSGINDTTGNRFHLLKELLLDTLPCYALMAALWLITGRNRDHRMNRLVLLMLLLAFAGILPLMVTLEQRGFYLVTALPFVASAMMLPFAGGMAETVARHNVRSAGWRAALSFTVVLCIAGMVFSAVKAGTPKRDHDLLHDIHRIGASAGPNITVRISDSLSRNWSFRQYLVRDYYISTDSGDSLYAWYILKPDEPLPPEELYREQAVGLRKLRLFRKKEMP